MIRHIDTVNSESWEFLPWKKFQKETFRLQKRVWKAVRAGDMQKARSLQKLILRSQGARCRDKCKISRARNATGRGCKPTFSQHST
jgi:retron-type reverse transcriptase